MMITSDTRTSHRNLPRTTQPGTALVVVGDRVPDWAEHWCRQCELPASVERVRAIAVIAAAAAREGAAVLAMAEARDRSGPPRVVVAVRALPDDATALTDAAGVASSMGADLVVAHGVPTAFGERSVGLGSAVSRASELLDAAVAQVSATQPELAVQA